MEYIDLTLQEGGSGVSDYDLLSNQPQINGVTLTGDKSSTDLGIFLPNGYTVTVATDGTGDFTDIQSALNSLQGKVGAGTVNVNLKAGNTFNITSTITIPIGVNISDLIIKSETTNTKTNITSNNTQLTFLVPLGCTINRVTLIDIAFTGSGSSISNSACIVNKSFSSYLRCLRTSTTNSVFGYSAEDGATIKLESDWEASNHTNFAVQAVHGTVEVFSGKISNCTNGLATGHAGVIKASGTPTLSNVTNTYGSVINQILANGHGVIISKWSV